MDLFKKGLAPIPTEGWEEINDRAEEVITSQLSARKVLHVEGPFGLEKASVNTGRLKTTKTKGTVQSALYDVIPLIESRTSFTLSRWELDNILRGEKDAELDNLEEAAEKIALFEEDAIYNGNKDAGIKGLKALAAHKLSFTNNANENLQAIAEGLLKLKDAYTEGPYYLIVGDEVFKALNQVYDGRLLINTVQQLIGGEVIRSRVLEGALLLPYDHDDLELTIGQDYSVGYETHTNEDVKLFIMNAFTFRCMDEDIVVYYKHYNK